LNPALPAAHRALVRIYTRLGDTEKSKQHQEKVAETTTRKQQQRERVALIRREAAERSRARRARLAERAKARQAETKSNKDATKKEGEAPRMEFLIVSGLPRSGTSLMMQMLAAGGLPIMTDGKRKADEDNPEGYYEWEEIKKIGQRPEILRKAEGRVIKVITALLPALPRRHRYKVIFMDRPVEEVVASQTKMIARRGTKAPLSDAAKMQQMLDQHRANILTALKRAKNFDLLKIDFRSLVSDPTRHIDEIVKFVGADKIPDSSEMTRVVRPELRRNRSESSPEILTR
jgi:hypothetical protein